MVCTFYMYIFQVQAKMEEMGGGGVWGRRLGAASGMNMRRRMQIA